VWRVVPSAYKQVVYVEGRGCVRVVCDTYSLGCCVEKKKGQIVSSGSTTCYAWTDWDGMDVQDVEEYPCS
jgi:hypothetical protein